jgi:ribosomal protein L7/L12
MFDVVLLDVGPSPILVIREVRAATGLDLVHATQLVQSGPTAILSRVSKRVADGARERLAATGCNVEVRAVS